MPERSGSPLQAIGIFWFRRADYRRFIELFEDQAELPDTFDDWLARAENAEHDLKQREIVTVRAETDPESFLAWCAANGFANVNSDARKVFASAIARDVVLKQGKSPY